MNALQAVRLLKAARAVLIAGGNTESQETEEDDLFDEALCSMRDIIREIDAAKARGEA